MSHAAAWFIAGWICAACFIAAGLWLHHWWQQVQRSLEYPDTGDFLLEDPRPTRRVRAGSGELQP
jgi:hypothetical protein